MAALEISTIIITRKRVDLLNRALRSLQAQRIIKTNLLVIIDDCYITENFLKQNNFAAGAVQNARWINIKREASDKDGPSRLATLRNYALQEIKSRWCTFLDDDNEILPMHYCQLLNKILESEVPAVHSWRSLWRLNGKPFYLKNKHPWCRVTELSKKLFSQYRDAGIYRVGSNIIYDLVVPYCREKSMVDMSEWFFETEFIRGIGFVQNYNTEDLLISHTEDAKLLDIIVNMGIIIPSTKLATLKYYMGGYSNYWLKEIE